MGLFKRRTKKSFRAEHGTEHLLSENSPFAVQEAYKAIRTNIMFSIPEERCKKIVISSSLQGEAKSTTAANLAIAFAQNHAKVLLIDCDLRLPTIASRLGISQTPGLTNLLVGLSSAKDVIHHLPEGLDVLPAGDIPPNPTELLGSNKMQKLLESLEGYYEYILIDTPPVTTVADAVILAKQTSGVILVVRQGVSTQESIADTLKKLEFSEANVLGFILTDVVNEKYKNYKKGYYGYGNSYSNRIG